MIHMADTLFNWVLRAPRCTPLWLSDVHSRAPGDVASPMVFGNVILYLQTSLSLRRWLILDEGACDSISSSAGNVMTWVIAGSLHQHDSCYFLVEETHPIMGSTTLTSPYA